MTLLTILPHVLYIIIFLINYNIGQGVFAFTSYPSFFHHNKCTFHKPSVLQLSSNSINNDDIDNYNNLNVAGVSVSPNGFLVILQSMLLNNPKQQQNIAFPISLTTPPSSTTSNNTLSNYVELPSLFQENYDQLSVTSPEALTFLQLLNGVDMATPILPPDTLSLVCVWYALLTEGMIPEGINDDDECIDDGNGGCLVEDELGLSSSSMEEDSEEQNSEEENLEALDYIRSMIKTTLPNSDDGDTGSITSNRYINASSWQRARVQLPRAWLHGVRIEEMNTDDILSTTTTDDSSNNNNKIGQVPLQYILQCSVDDGTKMLEIPLFSNPSSYNYNNSQSSSVPLQHQQKINISNEILQEITHNYNIESSASFISLALYHRYNKSGEGSADSPTLKVSTGLLDQLVEIQQDNEKKKEETCRYCWTLPTNTEEDINTIIQKEGLPLYRSLASIKEEDKRVLGKLKEQNFGEDVTSLASSSSLSSSSNSNNNTTTNSSSSTYRSTPQGTESSAGIGNVKKSLTLEQQAMQEKLKAAWKIAQMKEDEGALQRIQIAMEELELEVISKNNNPEEDSEYDEMINELREEQSTLDKIQQAMQDESDDVPERDYSGEEDVVGLISDLEEATTSASASAVDDEPSTIEEDDDDK